MKKAQLSLILILIIFVVMITGFWLYVKGATNDRLIELATKKVIQPPDADTVSKFAQECLQKSAKDGIVIMGYQGGFIAPGGSSQYNDAGTLGPYVDFDSKTVPYYIDGVELYIPEIEFLDEKLSNYVAVEFERCFEEDAFEFMGINATKSMQAQVEASLNEEDISVRLYAPIEIAIAGSKFLIDKFSSSHNAKLRKLHEMTREIIFRTSAVQPNQYDISSDCNFYSASGIASIRLYEITEKNVIVKLIDNNQRPFIFQFGMRNVNVTGFC